MSRPAGQAIAVGNVHEAVDTEHVADPDSCRPT